MTRNFLEYLKTNVREVELVCGRERQRERERERVRERERCKSVHCGAASRAHEMCEIMNF